MHIVTANRLADGLVVFFNGDGQWSEAIAGAEILTDDAAADVALEAALADVRANRVVDPYAVEVVIPAAGPMMGKAGVPVPTRLRERIRTSGPTAGHSLAKPHRRAA